MRATRLLWLHPLISLPLADFVPVVNSQSSWTPQLNSCWVERSRSITEGERETGHLRKDMHLETCPCWRDAWERPETQSDFSDFSQFLKLAWLFLQISHLQTYWAGALSPSLGLSRTSGLTRGQRRPKKLVISSQYLKSHSKAQPNICWRHWHTSHYGTSQRNWAFKKLLNTLRQSEQPTLFKVGRRILETTTFTYLQEGKVL